MTRFDVVLRGYDRVAVDALVAAVEAGDHERVDAAVTTPGALPVVLRGYDRAQVDAWLGRQPVFGKAEPSVVPGPERVIVLRGYRVAETDALLATVGSALAGDDPFRRADALRALAGAALPVVLRGYDRARIDAYLAWATRALRTG